MTRKQREVVIGISSSDVLTISFRDAPATDPALSKVVTVPLAELRTTEPDKAETRVGGAVLAVLEHVTGVDLKLRDYDKVSKEAIAKADALIKERAHKKSP